jgi:hypothetical protein
VNDWIRAVIGGLVGGLAMFVVGILFWATPLSRLAYANTGEAQGAAVQVALAANLPRTGRYLVPSTDTAGGTTLYGRGPVATIDYNVRGFPVSDGATMLGGYIQEAVAALLIAASLMVVAGRVPDFASRLRIAIGISAAATVMITLSDPIFAHGPWDFAIYNLVACLAMLSAAAFVIVRWFLPQR